MNVKSVAQLGLRFGVSFALIAGVSWLARIPIGAPAAHGLLRVAAHTSSQRQETCRERSADELAALPVHMRQPLACERRQRSYTLVVKLDDEIVFDTLLEPKGISGDRPVSIDWQLPLTPGEYRVNVAMAAVHNAPETDNVERFDYAETVTVQAQEIALLKLNAERGFWTLVQP